MSLGVNMVLEMALKKKEENKIREEAKGDGRNL